MAFPNAPATIVVHSFLIGVIGLDQSNQDFASSYRRFEDRFRGTQESITKRMESYIPLLEETEKQHASPRALDVGMGRGEWLRLLKGRGWTVSGVDHNHEMINSDGLAEDHIVEADALEYLRSCTPQSYELVSAFHVAEHLSHHDLRELIAEVDRVLTPGGALILETPNPENLTVSSWSFWMDPTHVRPLPPFLVSFLLEDRGFYQPFIFRLNGALPAVTKGRMEEIFANLFLSAPDYAVIAEKQPVASAPSAWRGKLTATTQPRPTDAHRLLTLARGLDQAMQDTNAKIDDRLAARIDQLGHHWDRTFDLSEQRFEALKVELRKDREITDLKIREFVLTLGQRFGEIKDEVEKLNANRETLQVVSAATVVSANRQNFQIAPQTGLSALANKRWKRLKNSIRKRVPSTVQEKAERRWRKLKRSIEKRLPGQSAPIQAALTEERSTPIATGISAPQSQTQSSEMTIRALDSIIERHSPHSRAG